MNARRSARAAALGCLAACALPVASTVLAVAPAGAVPAVVVEAAPFPAGPILGTEAETETEGQEPAEAENTEGSEKDNGLGVAIIAASLAFGLLCVPVLKIAGLKQN